MEPEYACDCERYVNRLESKMDAILDLLREIVANQNKCFKKRWACPDSNRRSSPCKGDVMTS